MIVFDYDVCLTLILAATLGEVLRCVVVVHIFVHNRFLHMSVVKITPICQGFQNTVCACLIANESSRMALYSTCLLFFLFFYLDFKPWLIHQGFPARMFGCQCQWWGYGVQNVSTMKRKNICFPNCRENQVNGDSIRTKKLKLQY